MHVSVGAIIKNDKNEILMIDRKIEPLGWACPAGHVDDGESPEEAVAREVKEEVGIDVKKARLIHEEFVDWNTCSKGIKGHHWYVFVVENFDGKVTMSEDEVRGTKWVSLDDVYALHLEKVWTYWHEKGLLRQ